MAARRVFPLLIALFTSPIASFAGTDSFVGEWQGLERGIAKLQISVVDDRIRLHVFGSCKPTPCDWGETDAQAYAPNVSVNARETAEVISGEFVANFDRTLLIIYRIAPDYLRVEKFTVFTDTTRRSPYHHVEVLRRAPSPR